MRRKTIVAVAAVAIVVAIALALLVSGLGPTRKGADASLSEGKTPLAKDTTNSEFLSDFSCPNCKVLLITVETTRTDHMECYGNKREVTPNFCRFAQNNVLFQNAYSPAPATIPTFKAIFSNSLISNESLVEVIAHYNDNVSQTLTSRLAKEGYVTVGITDHRGLGDLVNLRKKATGIVKGFSEFTNLGEGRETRTSGKTTWAVIQWLLTHSSEKFFLWTHLFDPHFNWIPTPEAAARFGWDAKTCGEIVNGIDIEKIRKLEPTLTAGQVKCLEALYDAELAQTDKLVGEILTALDELGIADETLVIISADHGEEFMDRSRVGHEWTVYNELVHVPLAVRNPKAPVTGRLTEPISTMAIHPIILGSTGGYPIELDDLVVTRAFHYYKDGTVDPRFFRTKPNEFALIEGSLKLIHVPMLNSYEFYDLRKDPGEKNNLWKKHVKAKKMAERLSTWIGDNHMTLTDATHQAIQTWLDTKKRLKALGYTR